jgi:predicted CXXCH cytochrome family protein
MKFTKLASILLVLFIAGSISSYAVITGSAHDFAGDSWNTTSEICIVCHTPHNANTTVTNAPLWNHALSAVASYTVYSNAASLNATVGQPSASTKLCLSCHDGTVALENFSGKTNGTNMISGADNLGSNLSNDHPVSFTYDAALVTADGDLKAITSASGIGSGTISSDLLFAGKMECASCHDVHNKANISHLLVKANTGSALCLTCHNK